MRGKLGSENEGTVEVDKRHSGMKPLLYSRKVNTVLVLVGGEGADCVPL